MGSHGNKVYHQINLASPEGWPNDYRSPGDGTTEKIPFHAKLDVPEVWVVDQDTKVPQLYVLEGSDYRNSPRAIVTDLPFARKHAFHLCRLFFPFNARRFILALGFT